MSKKLTGNGLWESSRMILPEFREAYNAKTNELKKRTRPNIDFDEAAEIEQSVADAYNNKSEITIKVYDPFNDREETGVIEKVDRYGRRIYIANEWVKFDDIVGVR